MNIVTDEEWSAKREIVVSLLNHIAMLRGTLTEIEVDSSQMLVKLKCQRALRQSLRLQ
jgi:hypothetical protein